MDHAYGLWTTTAEAARIAVRGSVPLSAKVLLDNPEDSVRPDVRATEARVRVVAGTRGIEDAGDEPALAGRQLMQDPESLCGVAFRYARWLRETGQWDAMDLFTFVIHPAVGWLAGADRTRVADITPAIIRRTLLIAVREGLDHDLAAGAWADFVAYLDVEGVPRAPLPSDLLL